MTRQLFFDSPTRRNQLLVDVREARYAAWDAVLTTAENNSGELALTIAPDHPAAALLCPMRTEIYIVEDETETWRGRLISADEDILSGRIVLVSKGIADYLHDPLVQIGTISTQTAAAALAAILAAHNAAVEDLDKRFSVGAVTATATVEYDGTQQQSPWNILKSITQTYGGRIVGRRDPATGIRYIDWISTEMSNLDTCTQTLEQGVNLLKLSNKVDGTDVITRLYGYGKAVNNVPVTVETVNNGLPYIEDTDAVAVFGTICGQINRSDIDDPAQLLDAMCEELRRRVEGARTLTASAVDLYDLGKPVEPFEIGKKVRTVARNGNFDELLRATKIQRALFNPKRTTITFGASNRSASSMIGGRT